MSLQYMKPPNIKVQHCIYIIKRTFVSGHRNMEQITTVVPFSVPAMTKVVHYIWLTKGGGSVPGKINLC